MSSQVLWKQPWSPTAEATLIETLKSQGYALRELPSQQWEPKTATIGGIRDYKASYLAPASQNWSSVMLHLNSLIGEALASNLSRATSAPAIAFFEYDQMAWGYCLFQKGMLTDRFWNTPEAVETPASDCVGNLAVMSETFGVSIDLIAPYIRHVPDSNSKAFPDDTFDLDDHWVRVDFMRRLGLTYPNPGKTPGGRHVKIECAGER